MKRRGFLNIVTPCKQEDITGLQELPLKCSSQVSTGLRYSKTLETSSQLVITVNGLETSPRRVRCPPRLFKKLSFLTSGASTSWDRFHRRRRISIFLLLSTTCRNGLKRWLYQPMIPER